MSENKSVPVCECEHAMHFRGRTEKQITPHEYAALIHDYHDVRMVDTDYGTFRVCVGCADAGHMNGRQV